MAQTPSGHLSDFAARQHEGNVAAETISGRALRLVEGRKKIDVIRLRACSKNSTRSKVRLPRPMARSLGFMPIARRQGAQISVCVTYKKTYVPGVR